MQICGKSVLGKENSKLHGTQSEKEHLRNRGPLWLEQSEQRESDGKFG